MESTKKELTANDSYILVKKGFAVEGQISYKTNLLEMIKNMTSNELTIHIDNTLKKDTIEFRKMLNELDKQGYCIYQLTRL